MKILKLGKKPVPAERVIKLTCRTCSSELEATSGEAHTSLPSEMTDPGHYASVTPARLKKFCKP